MNTFLISTGLCAILSLSASYLSFGKGKDKSWLLICLVGVVGAAMGSALGLLTAIYIGTFNSTVQEQTSAPVPLVAIGNGGGTTGAFLLDSGTVQSGHTYTFYFRNGDGSLSSEEVVANHPVHIIEDKNLSDTGYWTTTSSKTVLNSDPWLQDWAAVDHDEHIVRQDFHVPVGTVVQHFKLN
jgi:hypothetical protein